jgi:hypothetical protein
MSQKPVLFGGKMSVSIQMTTCANCGRSIVSGRAYCMKPACQEAERKARHAFIAGLFDDAKKAGQNAKVAAKAAEQSPTEQNRRAARDAAKLATDAAIALHREVHSAEAREMVQITHAAAEEARTAGDPRLERRRAAEHEDGVGSGLARFSRDGKKKLSLAAREARDRARCERQEERAAACRAARGKSDGGGGNRSGQGGGKKGKKGKSK